MRCIYCSNAPNSLEHMPPKSMFFDKNRPSGMEFATCLSCNNGTSAADLVASFMARLSPHGEITDKDFNEALKLRSRIDGKCPGLIERAFSNGDSHWTTARAPNGLFLPVRQLNVGTPEMHKHLSVFSAKLGMALYREYVGEALPLSGLVYYQHFLNAGLAQRTARSILSILPESATLRQGRINVLGQFIVRFNTDQKSIVAALSRFHNGLAIFTIATATPDAHVPRGFMAQLSYMPPGQLLNVMAGRPPPGSLPPRPRRPFIFSSP